MAKNLALLVRGVIGLTLASFMVQGDYMLDKIKEEIEDWEYHELKELQKEIKNGSQNLNKVISRKIKDFEQDTTSVCPVCNSVIDSSQSTTFTLIFGPNNLKKKASFCAFDCLQYFVSKLKELNKTGVKENEISRKPVR